MKREKILHSFFWAAFFVSLLGCLPKTLKEDSSLNAWGQRISPGETMSLVSDKNFVIADGTTGKFSLNPNGPGRLIIRGIKQGGSVSLKLSSPEQGKREFTKISGNNHVVWFDANTIAGELSVPKGTAYSDRNGDSDIQIEAQWNTDEKFYYCSPKTDLAQCRKLEITFRDDPEIPRGESRSVNASYCDFGEHNHHTDTYGQAGFCGFNKRAIPNPN